MSLKSIAILESRNHRKTTTTKNTIHSDGLWLRILLRSLSVALRFSSKTTKQLLPAWLPFQYIFVFSLRYLHIDRANRTANRKKEEEKTRTTGTQQIYLFFMFHPTRVHTLHLVSSSIVETIIHAFDFVMRIKCSGFCLAGWG